MKINFESFNVNFKEESHKYIDIAEKVERLIEEGSINDGDKLPSIRALSNFLGVNKDTVILAYKKLLQEGYLYQTQGSGSYARKRESIKNFRKEYNEIIQAMGSNKKKFIDLTSEITSAKFFEVEKLKEIFNEVLTRDGILALSYNDSQGYKELRKVINDEFWNGKNFLNNMLITSGAQQGIDIVSKALINVNDGIVVEKPTYSGAIAVFKLRKANVFEVGIEDDGIDIKALERILKKQKIKCLYTMSYFQNPTGISCSMEKKLKVLELAQKYNFYILEDDYLSELKYDDNLERITYRELDENKVIYVKSFSKIFLPGVRVGYVIAPDKFSEILEHSKISSDISTSSLMQRALEMYIKKGYWKNHIQTLKCEYSKRYNFIIDLINKSLGEYVEYIEPKGGLNIFLNIKKDINIDSKELFYELIKKKTVITPGIMYYHSPREGEKSFKLGFSEIDYNKIEKGIINIKDVFDERKNNEKIYYNKK
ncbi:MAG: PLP-dependent aminotransferase family protein [Sarcina sp.]